MYKDNTFMLFAYGGLILPESRSKTLEAEVIAIPAILTGFERFWGFAVPKFHLTTVSLRLNSKAACAGVLFPVSLEQLERLDLREEGYDRVEVPKDHINILESQAILSAKSVYTYVTTSWHSPSIENPIAQSDVDAILTGSFREHGDFFAREIVRTTTGWEGPWVDDRRNPRYPWALHEAKFSETIDQILRELVPKAFNKRKDNTVN